MIRVFFTIILPFILPTLLYLLWVSTSRRAASPAPAPWQALPWVWLVVAGVVLTAALLFFVNLRLGVPQGTYVPPHRVDGRVVPGQIVPLEPADRRP